MHTVPDNALCPIVVGGTGGSGTRLIVQMLQAVGVDMGDQVNDSLDALTFVPLYDAYINPFLRHQIIDHARFSEHLLSAIRSHRGNRSSAPWGWKNPRSIFLLPLLDAVLPRLHFVHVVRDGVDMATSGNQNQLRRYGRTVLGDRMDGMSTTLASALLWQRINSATADYGVTMPGRYWRIRFEDACENPADALGPLMGALSLRSPSVSWPDVNKPPARWRHLDPQLRQILRCEIGDTLERFGYPI